MQSVKELLGMKSLYKDMVDDLNDRELRVSQMTQSQLKIDNQALILRNELMQSQKTVEQLRKEID